MGRDHAPFKRGEVNISPTGKGLLACGRRGRSHVVTWRGCRGALATAPLAPATPGHLASSAACHEIYPVSCTSSPHGLSSDLPRLPALPIPLLLSLSSPPSLLPSISPPAPIPSPFPSVSPPAPISSLLLLPPRMPKAGVAGQDPSVGPARLARAPTRSSQSPKSYWVERVGETMAVLVPQHAR